MLCSATVRPRLRHDKAIYPQKIWLFGPSWLTSLSGVISCPLPQSRCCWQRAHRPALRVLTGEAYGAHCTGERNAAVTRP
jgi:hypothetical protein